jgi:hypothetical protein
MKNSKFKIKNRKVILGASAEANFSGGSPSPLPSPPGEGEGSSAIGASYGKRRAGTIKNEKVKNQNKKIEKVRRGGGPGLMKKVRANAAWNGLSREKRATLEQWLFEERLSYNAALERASTELGFTGSRTSLRRFYERAKSERLLSGLTETGEVARTVEKSDVSVDRLRNAGLKLAAEMFLRQVAGSPENTKEWAPLAKLLLQAEKNDSWRKIKEEENGIRQRTLDFARVKYQYNTMAHALKALPQLKEIERANMDPEVREFEDNKHINNLRRGMFGDAIPDLLPETPEERDHPEILRAREQAAYEKQMGIFAREQEERMREWAEMRAKTKVTEGATAVPGQDAVQKQEEEEEQRFREEDARDGADPVEGERPVAAGAYYPGGGK